MSGTGIDWLNVNGIAIGRSGQSGTKRVTLGQSYSSAPNATLDVMLTDWEYSKQEPFRMRPLNLITAVRASPVLTLVDDCCDDGMVGTTDDALSGDMPARARLGPHGRGRCHLMYIERMLRAPECRHNVES